MTMTVEGLLEEVKRGALYQARTRIREAEICYKELLRSGKLYALAIPAGTSSSSTAASPYSGGGAGGESAGAGGLAAEIAATRKRVEQSLKSGGGEGGGVRDSEGDMNSRVEVLEKENLEMKTELKDLRLVVEKLQDQVNNLSVSAKAPERTEQEAKSEGKKEEKKAESEEDEDIDLFGSESEEEDEETKRIKEERLQAYAAKKEKKPAGVAKSSIILDVKPWDDETDMKDIENHVRRIEMDGLLWGASKLVPLAYGIMKLQIMCVIEDDKVGVDDLTEQIEAYEDLVQSVDIAAFNKI